MTYQEFQKLYHEPRWLTPAALFIGVIDLVLFCCL